MTDWSELSEPGKLERRRAIVREDLVGKFHAEDWHGVADAAMDLREIDAELRVWRTLSEKVSEL